MILPVSNECNLLIISTLGPIIKGAIYYNSCFIYYFVFKKRQSLYSIGTSDRCPFIAIKTKFTGQLTSQVVLASRTAFLDY